MHNPTYLTLSRNRIFYFRCPLPRQAHPERKPSTLKVSLRTRDPKEALRISRYLGYAALSIFAYGATHAMQYHEMRRTLHQHFAELLASQRRKMQDTGPMRAEDRAAFETSLAVSIDAAQGLNSLNLIGEDTDLLGRFIEKYRLPLTAGTGDYGLFQAEFYKAYRDFCRGSLDHNRSLDSYDYGERQTQPYAGDANASHIAISEVIRKFRTEEIRVGRWVKRSEDQISQYLTLLETLIGSSTEVRAVSAETARYVKDTLLRLPKNMSKNPATRDKGLDELLAIDHDEKLTIRTVNSYLQAYSRLFQWAVDAGHTNDNPFAKSIIKENKRKSGKRQAFTPEQLQTIEAALLTTDTKAKPKEAHKWAALIAMYTGARLNEVCQLSIRDVRQHDGIWCFDLNDEGEGKHLKNDASTRVVPVHSRLLELGVLDYVEKLKQNLSAKLFPEYAYTRNYGWGKNLSVWFNTILLVRLGIKTKQLVFHSLRHSMTTKLFHADVQETVIQGLLGHSRKGVTQQHYFDAGYKIRQLQEAIEKF